MSKVIAESKGSCLHGREIKERGGEGEKNKKIKSKENFGGARRPQRHRKATGG